MGQCLTDNGLKPDPEKITSINNLSVPDDVAAVRHLLGTSKYWSSFIPGLAKISEPLRELSKCGCEWAWP